MLFIKLTRSNPVDGVYAKSLIAGPFEDDIDAQYQRKQLAAQDSNRDSAYEIVDWHWVVAVTRKGEPAPEVISWHESEDDCKAHAATAQRGDYTVVVEPMTYDAWLKLGKKS